MITALAAFRYGRTAESAQYFSAGHLGDHRTDHAARLDERPGY